MGAPVRTLLALTLVLAPACGEREAHAEGPTPPAATGEAPRPPAQPAAERQRAARAFDEGVALFKRAEYAAAARAFLEADRQSPSATAILNAIGAAKRDGDHLLVARTAERAIARGDAVVEARAALAEAATRLARLELGCEDGPCALVLDGEGVPPGSQTSYVLPGTHRIEARGAGEARAEERVVCAAGATYRITLHPRSPASASAPPPPRRGLHPAVHFTGVGVTAVLAAVTVWSGVDALAAKRALPTPAPQAQEDDVRARARRTDGLLGGALVAGAASAVLVFFTDWRPRTPVTMGETPKPPARPAPAAVLVPLPGGAAVTAGGRF